MKSMHSGPDPPLCMSFRCESQRVRTNSGVGSTGAWPNLNLPMSRFLTLITSPRSRFLELLFSFDPEKGMFGQYGTERAQTDRQTDRQTDTHTHTHTHTHTLHTIRVHVWIDLMLE